MKPFRNYILSTASALAFLLLTACSDEGPFAEQPSVSFPDGVYAIMPQLENVNVGNGPQSRSTLHYDYTDNKMKFNWEDDKEEYIGVFGKETQASCVQFTREHNSDTGALSYNKFLPPAGLNPIQGSQDYISYRPYTIAKDLTDYKNVPIHFDGQIAPTNPLLADYYRATYDYPTETQKATYLTNYETSEKRASSHLSAYDYLASGVVKASAEGNLTFTLYRLPAVTRFFLKCPEDVIYDSLQVVAKGKQFILKGTMDMEYKSISATKTSTVQTLKFQDGFDMRNKTTNQNYYKNGDEYVGYIVAYMMFAPIDLSDAESLYIYLFGHNGDEKTYYRAASVDKPNLTANMFYQWTSKNNQRVPITFEPVNVQDWENDAAYNNTDKGNGTGAW